MRQRIGLVAMVLLAAATAWADGGGGGDSPGTSPAEVEAAVAAIKAERYSQAIDQLRSYLAKTTNDADALNWLGFAYRKTGKVDTALSYYKRALAIDPQHRGAHEYIGEAYLQAGQPAMAERHLGILVRLCPQGCEQREDLEKAIAQFRRGTPAAAR